MSTIDDEIVRMSFDNKQFESGVATSMGTLDKLKSSLTFQNAGKGLEDVNRAVGGFNMHPMTSAIEGVNKMWLGMATVAVTAISNITNKVIDAGLKMGKSLTIDPLTAGFREYSTNLNSIQTIIANTGAKLPAVNETLRQLNEYSDKTIYNFSQMATNIGRFTAAGVEMSAATDAIKGMANTAALTGSTSEQLNSAMYQMSQALSSGTIRLMDWNSLVNANMGTENVQEALMATTRSFGDHGAAMDAAIKKGGNFRDSLQEGWLTAETFTKTMKVMGGTLNKETQKYEAFSIAQLQGMGYSAEAAKELRTLSQAAIDSATKVKTIGQAYDVIKESIGSGWAQVFQNIFGNFNQSKKMWTAVTEFITGGISSFFDRINKVLEKWNKLGGRMELFAGLKQAFKDLVRLFVPIKNAFKEVFPPTTGKTLTTLSEGFHSFFDLFRLNVKTMRVIREVFVAVFTGIKFGFEIIGALFGVFKDLFGLVGGASGGGMVDFLGDIAEGISDFAKKFSQAGLPKIVDAFKAGTKIIASFVKALEPLVPVLKDVGGAIGDFAKQGYSIAQGLIGGLLEGLNAASIQAAMVDLANNIVTWIKDALGISSPAETMVPIGVNIVLGIAEGILEGAKKLPEVFRSIFEVLASGLGLLFEGMGSAFKDAMTNMDLESFLEIINTLITGGFLLAATNIAKAFSGISKSASGVLDQISGSLKTMQSEVKAEIIKSIAISVLALAGAAYILSTLNGKKLAVSMGAIAGLMAGLTTSMKILMAGESTMSLKDVTKKSAAMAGMGAAMVAFSTSIVILAGAVKILGSMDQDTMIQGLEGVGAIVAGVVAATAILSKTGGGATIFATAAALLVLSFALITFAGTMKLYANLDWATIIDGGGKAAAVIIGIGLAMRAFGKFAITGSIGLLIASAALLVMAKALQKFAAIDPERMGDALVALVVTLGAVALAGLALSGGVGGAAALLVGAAAIIIIAKALEILAAIPGKDLAKAVFFMSLALAALALGAYLLTPAIPLIAALGAALLLFGQAVALVGVGVLAFAVALGILAIVGPAGFQAVYDGIVLLLELLPKIGHAVGEFVAAFIQGFVDAAVPLVEAIFKLLTVLADAIIDFQPKLREVFRALIESAFVVLESFIGRFIKFGIRVILAFLQGITDATPRIAHKAANIVIAFMDAIETEYPRVKRRAIKFIDFLKEEIGSAIGGIKDYLLGKAGDIGSWLIDGIVDGIESAWHWIEEKIKWITDHIPDWMKKRMGIASPSKVMRDEVGQWIVRGVAEGIDKNAAHVKKSSDDLAKKSLESMKYAFRNSRNAAGDLMDVQPKIKPVLDLTQLERDATQIGGKLGRHTINADVSRGRARDISMQEAHRRRGDDDRIGGETYNFIHNIKSKDPIDHVKVYRGTRSQIAMFKEVKGKWR